MAAAAGSYSWIIFNPIILRKSLGYSLVDAYMLTVPPAAFSTITTLIISRLSDKYRMRGPVTWFGTIVGIWGLAMVGFCDSPVARYAGIWIGEIGTNAFIVTCVAWGHNNIRTDGPRAVLSSLHVGSAAMGAIYSALVFRQQVGNHLKYLENWLTPLFHSGCTWICSWHRRHRSVPAQCPGRQFVHFFLSPSCQQTGRCRQTNHPGCSWVQVYLVN